MIFPFRTFIIVPYTMTRPTVTMTPLHLALTHHQTLFRGWMSTCPMIVTPLPTMLLLPHLVPVHLLTYCHDMHSPIPVTKVLHLLVLVVVPSFVIAYILTIPPPTLMTHPSRPPRPIPHAHLLVLLLFSAKPPVQLLPLSLLSLRHPWRSTWHPTPRCRNRVSFTMSDKFHAINVVLLLIVVPTVESLATTPMSFMYMSVLLMSLALTITNSIR